MAGFSMVEADLLRKWVGKKIREVIEKIKIDFIKKAAAHKEYKNETSQRIYEKMIEPAADYSFNKSHAACYAYISYQTAWLKAHHGLAFHAALLRSAEEDTDRLSKLIDEIKLQWYEVRVPDVNTSFEHIAAIDTYIQLWFVSIKGIGEDIAQFIEKERATNGDFASLTDFLTRCSEYMNKKSLEALTKSWALDSFENRATLLDNISRILDWIKWSQQQKESGGGLFDMWAVEGANLDLPPSPDFTVMQKLAQEFAVFKSLVSAHPFDGMYGYLRGKYTFISMMKDVEWFGDFTVLGMIKSINRGMKWGFFMTVEDISWEMEFFISEKLDLQVFDIVNITWYKGRRFPQMDKITVLDFDSFQKKVQESNKYDPKKTVALVRKERFSIHASDEKPDIRATRESSDETSAPSLSDPNNLETTTNNQWLITNNSWHTADVVKEIAPTYNEEKNTFPSPDNMMILAKIPSLIKAHPGDIDIKIGNMEAKVSEEGLGKIQELLR